MIVLLSLLLLLGHAMVNAQEPEIDIATRVCLAASPNDANCVCGGVLRCRDDSVVALVFENANSNVSGTLSSEIGRLTSLTTLAARDEARTKNNCACRPERANVGRLPRLNFNC